MSEMTILRDERGDYYAVPSDVLAAARTPDGVHELDAEALEAARMPASPDEVSGYISDPIPGVDIIVKKKPGSQMATFTGLGTVKVPYGDTGDDVWR